MKRKVVLAAKTGFCFGVKRAVSMAEKALEGAGPIYSLGSIIHNAQVVGALERKGLKAVKDIAEINGGAVVISSHGLSPKTASAIKRRALKIIDTTCPFVLKAQRIAGNLSRGGYLVVIVGDASHPEVRALVDFVSSGRVVVVKGRREARALKIGKRDRVSIISQTTQSTANFLDVVDAISASRPAELKVCNTICRDAEDRQRLARALACRVDLMLVIGGRDSANTRRLLEVCRDSLKKSYLVETEDDLRPLWFKGVEVVGITSGASTPDFVIRKVVNKIRS